MKNPYNDIINLPNHKSSKHAHMSKLNRAAQFSPFMALTGYESVISETARLTDKRIELDEHIKEDLNKNLLKIKEDIDEKPEVVITYFQKDKKKFGGVYLTTTGYIKKIIDFEGLLIMQDNTRILIDDILEITYRFFGGLEDYK